MGCEGVDKKLICRCADNMTGVLVMSHKSLGEPHREPVCEAMAGDGMGGCSETMGSGDVRLWGCDGWVQF